METKVIYEAELETHIKCERAAVKLQNKVGKLLYDKGIELVFFRHHLIDITISEILNLHDYAEKVVNCPVDVFTTAEISEALYSLNLAPAKLDLGKLSFEWLNEKNNFKSKEDFLNKKLNGFNSNDHNVEPRDVVLYGFGRIGRLVARELIKQAGKGQQLRLRAIVTRNASDDSIIKRAALLRNDSVHGAFKGSVIENLENKSLLINGQIVQMISANSPEEIDYTNYGINNALIIDNTGVFTTKEQLSRHLKAKGAGKVLLTAPGKEIPNIVYGINHFNLDLDTDDIYIALYTSSATLNATTDGYTTSNEISNASGSAYSAGGKQLTSVAVTEDTNSDSTTAGSGIFDAADPEWTSASFTARGALIYNKTLGDASSNTRGAIAILDFGGDFTVSGGTFKIVLPTASRSNAIIRID